MRLSTCGCGEGRGEGREGEGRGERCLSDLSREAEMTCVCLHVHLHQTVMPYLLPVCSYPDHWLPPGTPAATVHAWVQRWLAAHAAACRGEGGGGGRRGGGGRSRGGGACVMPVVLTEFGARAVVCCGEDQGGAVGSGGGGWGGGGAAVRQGPAWGGKGPMTRAAFYEQVSENGCCKRRVLQQAGGGMGVWVELRLTLLPNLVPQSAQSRHPLPLLLGCHSDAPPPTMPSTSHSHSSCHSSSRSCTQPLSAVRTVPKQSRHAKWG